MSGEKGYSQSSALNIMVIIIRRMNKDKSGIPQHGIFNMLRHCNNNIKVLMHFEVMDTANWYHKQQIYLLVRRNKNMIFSTLKIRKLTDNSSDMYYLLSTGSYLFSILYYS